MALDCNENKLAKLAKQKAESLSSGDSLTGKNYRNTQYVLVVVYEWINCCDLPLIILYMEC